MDLKDSCPAYSQTSSASVSRYYWKLHFWTWQNIWLKNSLFNTIMTVYLYSDSTNTPSHGPKEAMKAFIAASI